MEEGLLITLIEDEGSLSVSSQKTPSRGLVIVAIGRGQREQRGLYMAALSVKYRSARNLFAGSLISIDSTPKIEPR